MLKLTYGSYAFSGAIPDISIDTSIDTTSAGSAIGATVNIGIRGTIFATGTLNDNANFDSGASTSTTYAFTTLLSVITGMQNAFSKDYKELKLECNSTKILPENVDRLSTRVNSISFSPSSRDPNILRSIDYNINLTVDSTGIMTYISGFSAGAYVSSIQNSYSIESLDTLNYYGYTSSNGSTMYPPLSGEYLPTYRITRTIGATGKEAGSFNALINAKRCVSGMLDKDVQFLQVLNNLTVFERNSSVDMNPIDGTYTIVDTYTAISGSPLNNWTETFTLNHSVDDTLKRTVTINGTIQGLGKNWPTSMTLFQDTGTGIKPTYQQPAISKYQCASGAFDIIKNQLYQRVISTVFPATTGGPGNHVNYYKYKDVFSYYSGIINPIPLSISVDHDPMNGSVSYNYTYDTRPISLVSGAITENLSVEDTYGTRSYAQLAIMRGRPMYQDLGTYSSSNRTASYEGSFPSVTGFLPPQTITYINNTLNEFDPKKLQNTFFSQLIKDDINTDIVSGRYTRSKTWIYQKRS